MPDISTKENFIKELTKFTKTSHGDNLEVNFSTDILIEETEKGGKGKIHLDISKYIDSPDFFIKIAHQPNHTIGDEVKHNDGIIIKVNLIKKQIDIFMFELKKTLRFNNLKIASKQLASAYRFMRFLDFEECFSVNYKFFLVHETNNLERDSDELKGKRGYYNVLFEAVYEKKTKIPLMIPLCKYRTYDFAQLSFDSRTAI